MASVDEDLMQKMDLLICLESDVAIPALLANKPVMSLSCCVVEDIFGEYEGVLKVHAVSKLAYQLEAVLSDEHLLSLLRQQARASIGSWVALEKGDGNKTVVDVVERIVKEQRRKLSPVSRAWRLVNKMLARA
ncbi:MAG: hypothetical protein HY711_04575 [Candidatus Melainabacteria bacterium]|nr:hypothetical protein [Candidatus Melainabacteria bacterium]